MSAEETIELIHDQGGIATAPLVMALIFSPNGTADWVVASGAWGLFTLLMATFLISFVFIKHCLKRKFNIRLALSNMTRPLLDKAKQLNGIKVAACIAGVTVLMVFLPFFIELFNALVFVVGFVIAARLGLLDHIGYREQDNSGLYDEEYHINYYNSATNDHEHNYFNS